MAVTVTRVKNNSIGEVRSDIVNNNFLTLVSTQSNDMKLYTFMNMSKMAFSEIILQFLGDAQNLNSLQITEWAFKSINFNMTVNGDFLYYIQEQLLYAAYRVFLECTRFVSGIRFNAAEIRNQISTALGNIMPIFY